MKKLLFIAILFLNSCATTGKIAAADDILEFATGLQNNDSYKIERHLDRESLKRQANFIARDIAIDQATKQMGNDFKAKLAAVAIANLAKPIVDMITDEALSAENLSYFAQKAGLNQNLKLPSRFKTSLAIQYISDTKVCIPDDNTKKCILYFGQYPDAWKLYAIDEAALRARLKAKNYSL